MIIIMKDNNNGISSHVLCVRHCTKCFRFSSQNNPLKCDDFYYDQPVERISRFEVGACPSPLSCSEPESCLTPKPMFLVTCWKPPRSIEWDGQRTSGQEVVLRGERTV